MTKVVLAAALLAVAATDLFAGNGKINNDGTVTLTVDFRFAPTQAQINLTTQRLTDFSAKLWDASEGQMRISSVKIACGTVDEDLADIWLSEQLFPSSAFNSPLGQIGVHYQHTMDHDALVMFHEFGHYGLQLGDEYQGQFPCGGKGPCLDGTRDGQNQCIMHDESTFDNEFCVLLNHDLLRGNNAGCQNKADFGGAPCISNCTAWNTVTQKYESSDQQQQNGKSCWESLSETFPFLTMPNGLPQADPPGGFVPPQFDVTCSAVSTIVFVLDKSGSMSQPVDAPAGEICQNGIDDNDDAQIDESPCSKSRLDFVHAAARQLIDAAAISGARVGVVSFNDQAQVIAPIADLDANSAEPLKTLTDAITAGGATAIGEALVKAKELLDADVAPAAAKAVIIITDGANTSGIPPEQPVPDYVAAGIRIFPVATGNASDDPTLASIANKTNGIPFAAPKPSQMLMAVNEAWTQWRGETQLLGRTQWSLSPAKPAKFESFIVDKATKRITLTVTAEMQDIRAFAVRARLIDPNGDVFESNAPPAAMRVSVDPFFVRATIVNPASGVWHVKLTGTGRRPQRGSLAVTSTHRGTRLIATSNRWTATTGERITIELRPWIDAPLRNAAVSAVVRRPNGKITHLQPRAMGHGLYTVTLGDLDTPGTYAITTTFATNDRTRTEPGEAPPAKMIHGQLVRERRPPPRRVPPAHRSVTRYIVVSMRPPTK